MSDRIRSPLAMLFRFISLSLLWLGGVVSSLQAQDSAIGPQLFTQEGKGPLVLMPSQGAMNILPRQHLWQKGREDWVSYKGWLSSTFQGKNRVSFIYRKTVFEVNEDLSLKLIRKAPSGLSFLATSGAGEKAPVLTRRSDGEFASMSASGNFRPFPFLSPYKDRVVLSWSSAKYPFLYFPRQNNQEEPVLCAFDPSFERGRHFDQGLLGFSLKGISEGEEGVFLIGEEGENLLFDGRGIRATPLPGGLSEEGLVSYVQIDGHWSGLYQREDGGLSMAMSGGETVDLPSTELAKVQVEREQEAHIQSVMMFGVMMVALFMVLRWRQEGEAQMTGELTVDSASLWLRSFAFIMDFFLLSIPVSSMGQLLGIEAIPLVEMAHIDSLSPDQMTELLGQFALVNVKMAGILVILSIFYHVALEQWLGGSFGKLFFRVKVVDGEGKAPNFKASLIKALWRSLDVAIFPLISFISAISHKERLSLGDRFSGLKVVQTRRS